MKKSFNILKLMRFKFILLPFVGILSGFLPVLSQDTIMVHGVIKSISNEPVSNVSVSIEGSTMMPVLTDEEGAFTIPSVTGHEWLIISPTGNYKSRRVLLNKREDLMLYLAPKDIVSGDDQVSLLSRQLPRRNLVPAFSELNTSDIYQTASYSLDQHMQGRIPGMYVINRSGMPASGAATSLRGIRSLLATNMPVYMVDGVPVVSHGIFGSNLTGYEYNALMGINPFDISKTFVFKDPAVGSAFGSRGSNGIILVETLDPSVTQTSIEVNLRTGYSLAPSNLIPQLNAAQHKTLMNEVLFSSGAAEEDIRELYPSLFLEPDDERFIDYQHDTYWQDYIFNNSMLYNMNVKVKGGDEIARYGLSFGYLDSDGIIKNTGYQGYNLRFVSRLNIFRWLKMDAGVSLNYNNARLKESAAAKETSPILTSLAKSPLLNPYQYDVDGNETNILSEPDEIGVSNPLAVIQNYEAFNHNYNFTARLGLIGMITDDLLLTTNFSFNYDVLKEQIFQPNRGMEPYYDNEAQNVSIATNNDLTSLYNNTFLRYSKSFGTNHRILSNTGFYVISNKYQLDWGLTKNAHENDEYRELQDGQNNLREIGGDNRSWNWLSFYEHITYVYDDRYFLTGSLTLDGSSRVGRNADNTLRIGNVPYGLFYSGGVSWRISNESFLRNLAWLEDLRLRFTAGQSGNDDFGESTATNYYKAVRYRETMGLYPAILPNERLTYERVNMLNFGADLALIGNRISLEFDYYISNTTDMVILTPVEFYLGYEYRIENGGSMQNRGYEAELFVRLINAQHFKWDIDATFSTVKNEVIELKTDKMVYAVPGGEKINLPGYPSHSFYGYIYKGVFSTQEEATAAGLVNDRGIAFTAGDAIYEDISGPEGVPDYVIDEYDKTVIGSPLPDYYGGITNTFSYRGFSLSASLEFIQGFEVFNYVRLQNEKMTGLENQSTNVLNRWQYEGQQTDVPRALWNDPIGNSDFSSRWIEDGSFMRVKYIKLSYTLPTGFNVFNSAEVYFSVNNIFTLSNYLGYDPEFAYSYSPIYQGIDYGLTPIPRQFIFGINIGL